MCIILEVVEMREAYPGGVDFPIVPDLSDQYEVNTGSIRVNTDQYGSIRIKVALVPDLCHGLSGRGN